MAEKENAVVRGGIGGIVPHGPVFHWKDGWYFCRGECLDVHIWNANRQVDLTIPANEWISIVGHLSHPDGRIMRARPTWMQALLIFTVLVAAGYGCFHFGYVLGYVDALQWAKGVNFDQ